MTSILNFARQRLSDFTAHHQNGPKMFWYMGVLGAIAYPSLYLLRYFKSTPVYDDWWLRLINMGLCLLLLQKGWPEQLKRYYMPFSYVALIFMLPFSLVFVALKNQGGAPAVVNTVMAIYLVILLTDWRNTIITLCIGFALGVLAYLLFEPQPVWPRDFLERAPVVFITSIAAAVIKTALVQATKERIEKAERLERDSRIAALQETIGFLAHEVNTPLGEARILLGGVIDMYEDGAGIAPDIDAFRVAKPGDVVRMLAWVERRAAYSQDIVQRFMRSAYHVRYDGEPQAMTASSIVASLRQNYPFPDDKRNLVQVVTMSDFEIKGSRELMYLVLSTLIQNSLLALRKHPAPQLLVEIGARGSPERGGGTIRVTDNGCGVPPEVLSRLTKEAVPSGWQTEHGGGGMGLMFCQRVMEGTGGEISIESTAGKGTSVTLTFRAAPDTSRTDLGS